MSAALMIALVIRWLEDGSADAIIAAIRDEAAARQRLADAALAGHAFARHPCGHHVWLPVPRDWVMTEFTAHLQRQGLAVVSAESFDVTGTPPHAIRVSLGAAASRAELAAALRVLAGALRAPTARQRIV
jgi:DNA-binding transcriptional MocR family regulator